MYIWLSLQIVSYPRRVLSKSTQVLQYVFVRVEIFILLSDKKCEKYRIVCGVNYDRSTIEIAHSALFC